MKPGRRVIILEDFYHSEEGNVEMVENDKVWLNFSEDQIVHCIQRIEMDIVEQISLAVLFQSLVFG